MSIDVLPIGAINEISDIIHTSPSRNGNGMHLSLMLEDARSIMEICRDVVNPQSQK